MCRYGKIILWLVMVVGVFLIPGLSLGAEGTGLLVVSWESDSLDHDVEGFRVYVSTDRKIFRLDPSKARRLVRTETVGPDARVAVVQSLAADRLHHVAVTSHDSEGNESEFSDVISGRPCLTAVPEAMDGMDAPEPTLCAISPREITQGASEQMLTMYGAGFDSGTDVDLGPGIVVEMVDSPEESVLHVMVSVDSSARLDPRDISVIDGNGRRSVKRDGFEVLLDRRRADIDESGSIDEEDMRILADAFNRRAGDSRYEKRLDLNADGAIDGFDLSLLVSLMAPGRPGQQELR